MKLPPGHKGSQPGLARTVAGRVDFRKHHVEVLAALLLLFNPLLAVRAVDKSDSPHSALVDVRAEHLLATPPGENWTSYNGDYTGRRFTALSEITPANVAQLRAQWVFHVPESTGLENTPTVVNGVMLVSSGNDAYALDARTGRMI